MAVGRVRRPARRSPTADDLARRPPARHAATWRCTSRRGFARDVAEGRSPAVGLHVDGTNSSIAGRGAGYAEAITREARAGAAAGTAPRRAEPTSASSTTPSWRAASTWCPGIIVMLVTIISALVTGMAVVREKELGTLEQVQVTPLSSLQFIAGKTLPFALIALVDLVAGHDLRDGLVPRAA